MQLGTLSKKDKSNGKAKSPFPLFFFGDLGKKTSDFQAFLGNFFLRKFAWVEKCAYLCSLYISKQSKIDLNNTSIQWLCVSDLQEEGAKNYLCTM
jgi:hypothetical protein